MQEKSLQSNMQLAQLRQMMSFAIVQACTSWEGSQ